MMGKVGYQPRNKGEICRELGIGSDGRSELRAELARLEREGEIVRGNKSRYRLRKDDGNALIGTLKTRMQGGGWFFPDQKDEANIASGIDLDRFRRIFIPARKLSVALDGDRVQVRIDRVGPPDRKSQGGRKGPESAMEDEASGWVEKIIERRSGVVIGTYMVSGKFRYVAPDDDEMPASVELVAETTASAGQKVAVELVDWARRDAAPQGRVVKVLGWPGDPGVDILSIIEAHGLRTEFPEAVLEEAKRVAVEIPEEELVRRDDWREKFVFTIDPADAKDFDDAILVRALEHGWELAVHIADVAHYVKPEGPLDKEAVARGNSTYLVGRVLPMLPPELSNGICSLRPHEDRLTGAAIMRFNQKGEMGKVRFVKAVINSKARLNYAEAQALLADAGLVKPDDVQAQAALAEGVENREAVGEALAVAWELAKVLRQRRFRNGALDLEMPEIRMVLDALGTPTGYQREEYNESHQLIEEFMLAANEAVAIAIRGAEKPGVYRIHEDPEADKLAEFAELAESHGFRPGDLTNRKNIQKLLDAAKGQASEFAIKLGLLKSLKRAVYADEPLGHYGLAKDDYCHFTSPIRRYADLIMHRALEPLLRNPPANLDRVPSKVHCHDIADHISTTERVSASAEDATHRLKLMQWLEAGSKLANPPEFVGVITDVRKIGLMVEASEIMQRGVVKREAFPPGDWRLDASRARYVSRDAELVMGEKIRMVVDHVDMERGFVDFRVVEGG